MRYLGNETKLLTFIEKVIDKYKIEGEIFAELFAGTGLVGDYFKGKYTVYSNDYTYFSKGKSRVDKREHNCTGRSIYEKDLHEAIIKAINETLVDREVFLQQISNNFNAVLADGLSERLADLDSQLKELEAEIISLAIGGRGYDELASKILELRDERDTVAKELAADANMQQRIDEMETIVKNNDTITEYGDVLVRRLVKKVTIFEKEIVVDFKSGVNIAMEI